MSEHKEPATPEVEIEEISEEELDATAGGAPVYRINLSRATTQQDVRVIRAVPPVQSVPINGGSRILDVRALGDIGLTASTVMCPW
ncbi:MAG: hypothetical protein OXU20_36565 [Myxococcales bacterium]|nr:hypothetical protein [Myxococcales bacterium]MDD9967915.1 hypothetical protein [Myxococcales bacterium]